MHVDTIMKSELIKYDEEEDEENDGDYSLDCLENLDAIDDGDDGIVFDQEQNSHNDDGIKV